MELVSEVYVLMKKVPEVEKYGLISQIKRSAVSIPSNIAEGTSRRTSKDISRFLDIALGSSYELETQILLLERLQYAGNISQEINKINRVQQLIGGFKKKINS